MASNEEHYCSLRNEADSVSCNVNVAWLQQIPPRDSLGRVARQHTVLYGTSCNIGGVEIRLKLTKNGSSLGCTLLANKCTAFYTFRVVAQEGYIDYTYVGLADCATEASTATGLNRIHQWFAIEDLVDDRNHLMHGSPRQLRIVADVFRAIDRIRRVQHGRIASLPLRLRLSMTRKHIDTPLFLHGSKLCGDPVCANGRVWFLTAYVEGAGVEEKLCVGLRVLRYTAQKPPCSMHCCLRLNLSEARYIILDKTPVSRDVEDLQLFRSFRFREVFADEKYWSDERITVQADIIESKPAIAEPPPPPPPPPPRRPLLVAAEELDKLRENAEDTAEIGDYVYCSQSLGCGAFGAVHKGCHKETRQEVAVKAINFKGITEMASIAMEIVILKEISGSTEHLVSVFDVYPTPSKVILIMELCNAGDLHDFMHSGTGNHHGALSEGVIRHFLRHIVSGMKVLHSKGIIHRDLKPENLLLHDPLNGGSSVSPYQLCLKIADFGVARFMAEGGMAGTVIGTALYMAPELLVAFLSGHSKGRYSANVDLWSIGVILYECLMGDRPFKDHDLIKLACSDELVDVLPPSTSISASLAYLVTSLLQPRPEKRATFDAFFTNAFCEESVTNDATAESSPCLPETPNSPKVLGSQHPAESPGEDALVSRRASSSQPMCLGQSSSTGISTSSSCDSTGPSSRRLADHKPPTTLKAVVLRDYYRRDLTEIDLSVGDIITHIQQVNGGWWRGLCNGKCGMFPAKHVQLM